MRRFIVAVGILTVGVFSSACLGAQSSPLFSLVGELTPGPLPTGVSYASRDENIDIFRNHAVVGAGIFRQGEDEGRAFVYDISNPGSPVEIAELRASDNQPGNEFGDSVAVTDHYVFVGAWGTDGDRGAVYMYDISDPNNITERKITAFDSAVRNNFGFDLSVSGNRLIVAAPSFSTSTLPAAAYVLDFSDPDNIQQRKLLAAPGSVGGNFAEQVDIEGDFAIVGHISESTQFPFSGAAHLFDLANNRQRVLRATDAPNHRAFSRNVAIDGTRALVSVSSDPGPDDLPGASRGAVWAFDFSNWNSIAQHEFGIGTGFGSEVQLSDGVSVISTGGSAMHVHNVDDVMNPVLLETISPPPGSQGFASAIEFRGNLMIVGGNNRAYIYHLIPEPSSILSTAMALILISLVRFHTGK